MNASAQRLATGAFITLYACWNARHLPDAWLHSPYDRGGSIAFLLWLAPLFGALLIRSRGSRAAAQSQSSMLFLIAFTVSFAGVILDLNALKDLALAAALAGFLPVQPITAAWLACAIAWLPAAGWFFRSHPVAFVNFARVAIGLIAASLTPFFNRRAPAL